MVDKKKIDEAVRACLQDKGKRKFTQSVDLAINFKGVDFKKAENRLNTDVVLPSGGKESKVAVFADGEVAAEAKKYADLVIPGSEIPAYASDKAKQKELVQYSLLATPPLMPTVGKQLGQVLAGRGKLPKPIMPNMNVANLVAATRKTVSIKNKGKFLPSIHCLVGNENLKEDELSANIAAVLEAIEKKIPETSITTIYLKTTMGKPVKVL